MKDKHTPKWKWKKVEGDHEASSWSLDGPDVLCRFWYDKPPSKDALCIEAAPDMLAILREFVAAENRTAHGNYCVVHAACAKAEALIAKLDGDA